MLEDASEKLESLGTNNLNPQMHIMMRHTSQAALQEDVQGSTDLC